MLTVQANVMIGKNGRQPSFTLNYNSHRTKLCPNILFLSIPH